MLFGEHSSGQSKKALAKQLGLDGEIVSIYETINAVHIKMTSEEAHRLSLDKRVLHVHQDRWTTTATQTSPGWALDRLDEQTATLDNTYNDTPSTGAGRTIYILDSGLDLENTAVAAEFTDSLGNIRASVIWDVNGDQGVIPDFGKDCIGHGTQVASIAAGNTYGVAKGATVIAAKITQDSLLTCLPNAATSTSILAFDWLATNAPAGSIVNWSQGLKYFHIRSRRKRAGIEF